MAVYAHAGKGILLFPKIPYTSCNRMPLGSVLHKEDRAAHDSTALLLLDFALKGGR